MKFWCAVVLAAVLTSTGCTVDPFGTRAPTNLASDAIRTDAAVYALKYQPGIYTVRIRAEYTNRTGSTVYLHRRCGYGDKPHRNLIRSGSDTTSIWLNEGVCITRPLRSPISVQPGDSYSDEFELVSTESPHAQPPITMAMRTGAFQLVYHVQRSNRVEGWGGVDLLPLAHRISNVFRVQPAE